MGITIIVNRILHGHQFYTVLDRKEESRPEFVAKASEIKYTELQ